MKKYQVFEDGTPADCNHCNVIGEAWITSIFENKRDAEIYAFMWAFPISKKSAAVNAPEMEINKEYDYSMCEFPVMMMIKEID